MTSPRFTSFDDAWRWFVAGGALAPIAERIEGFTAGRAQLLSFRVPVTEPDVLDAIADVQDALADIDGVLAEPPERLHISIYVPGFQVIETRHPDEVLRQDVGRIAERAAKIIKATPAIELQIGPIAVFPDALMLEVHDGGHLAELYAKLAHAHHGVGAALRVDDFLPHITIATFGDPAVATVLRERLPAMREQPSIAMSASRVELSRIWFTGVDPQTEIEIDTVRTYTLRR